MSNRFSKTEFLRLLKKKIDGQNSILENELGFDKILVVLPVTAQTPQFEVDHGLFTLSTSSSLLWVKQFEGDEFVTVFINKEGKPNIVSLKKGSSNTTFRFEGDGNVSQYLNNVETELILVGIYDIKKVLNSRSANNSSSTNVCAVPDDMKLDWETLKGLSYLCLVDKRNTNTNLTELIKNKLSGRRCTWGGSPDPVSDVKVDSPQAGGKAHKKHNGRTYVVRTGSRGGKYILVKGNKVYV
jgi:hypothetical protein